jgi:glycine/D-amino acid oxidase-like deaminating enzyme
LQLQNLRPRYRLDLANRLVEPAFMKRDVVIVGGGIIGCSAAHFLTRAGLSVTLLEKRKLAQGTTGNSFAWANASTKIADETYHRFNATGVAGYEALAAEFGAANLGIYRTGALQVVGRSDSTGFHAMQDRFAALQRFQYPCEWWDEAKLRTETPGLTLPSDAEALHLPADMVIDAPRVAQSLAEIARKGGADIRENCHALSLVVDEDGEVKGVNTSVGRFEAPKVALAAGADTGRLLAELTGFEAFSTRFPMREVPGLLLTTPPLDHNTTSIHLKSLASVHSRHVVIADNFFPSQMYGQCS